MRAPWLPREGPREAEAEVQALGLFFGWGEGGRGDGFTSFGFTRTPRAPPCYQNNGSALGGL